METDSAFLDSPTAGFLLFTVFTYCIYPTLTSNLRSQPVVLENVLLALLLCLALGDIAHVAATITSLPPSILHYPMTKWTSLVWGNILMPSVLFFARYVRRTSGSVDPDRQADFEADGHLRFTWSGLRCAWFLGVGRPTYGLDTRKERIQPHPQAYARVPTVEGKQD